MTSSSQSNGTLHFKHTLLIVVPLALLVVGQMFGKMGSESLHFDQFNLLDFLNAFLLLAYACMILQGIVWILAVRRFDLSFAYPFMSLSFILVLVISYFVFNETITLWKAAGSLSIILGVVSISLGEQMKKKKEG